MDTDVDLPKPRSEQPVRFEPVLGSRPADEIVAQIRAKLSAQVLRVGDRLPSERELSEQFGVSRNSVRQALRSLVETGLLGIRKGTAGGAFIQEGGGDAVLAGLSDLYFLGHISPEDLTEVRILLGVEAVRLACQRGTEEEIDALEANVALAAKAAREGNIPERTEHNLEFHRMLARMARNPLLATLSDAVLDMTRHFVEQMGASSNRSVMPLRRKLIGHLRRRDEAAAAQEMRDHLLKLRELYLSAARKVN